MAVTVAGKNYTQISSCDTSASQGTWSGLATQDTAAMKEGIASLCGILKSSGTNDATFTPTTPISLSGVKHLRFWLIAAQGGLVELYANGGIQIGITDGTNTAFYYVGGRDTYPGGWHNFVVDISKTPDSGTRPTGNITVYTIRIVLTAAAKNAVNTWVDNLCVCDGLITYGDDVGGYYSFEKVFNICDNPSTGGWGILTKKAGVYCLTGSMEFGDASGSSGTKFQAKQQVVVFENRPNKDDTLSNINSNLMNITAIDNGTGTTEFILGSESGGAGIEGCTIRVANTTQIAKFKVDGGTDTDVDNFKLYGSTFLAASSVSLPANATGVKALNCNFEACGEVLASTAVMKYCNFVSSPGKAIKISSTSHNVTDCNFINCQTAVHHDVGGSTESHAHYDYNKLMFTGGTYHIENSASTPNFYIDIDRLNGSNPDQAKINNSNGGSTTILPISVVLTLTGLIAGSDVRIMNAGTTTVLDGTDNSGTTFNYSYNYGTYPQVDIIVLHLGYEYYRLESFTPASTNASMPIPMRVDRWYANP